MLTRIHKVCLSFIVAYGLVSQAYAEDNARLWLRDHVVISKPFYRLEDIVSLEKSSGPRLNVGVLNMKIGKTPRPGYFAKLSIKQLASKFDTGIELTGARWITIEGGGVSLDGSSVANVAMQALTKQLQNRFDTYTIASPEHIVDTVVPQGKLELKARVPHADTVSKRMMVWVDILINDEHFSSVPLWFSVSAFHNVFIANRFIDSKSRISSSDFEVQYRDISHLGNGAITAMADLESKRLKRRLPLYAVLTTDLLEEIPPVVRGQIVTVNAQSGDITIQAKALAMHDGFLRQRVNLKHPKTGERYVAVIHEDGQIWVE